MQQFSNGQGPFDREILLELHYILDSINPFVHLYKTAKERMDTAPQDESLQVLLSPQMRLVMETSADRRRENLPTANELAAIIPDEYGQGSFRDIVLEIRNPIRNGPKLSRISATHAAYMPLHYVLLFPYGDLGWHWGLDLRESNKPREDLQLH